MGTTLEAIKGVTNYPIPARTIELLAGKRGVELTATATSEVLNSSGFRLLEADVKMWLVSAPSVSEGGVSFSFSQAQREAFKEQSNAAYSELESRTLKYGYKGEWL